MFRFIWKSQARGVSGFEKKKKEIRVQSRATPIFKGQEDKEEPAKDNEKTASEMGMKTREW